MRNLQLRRSKYSLNSRFRMENFIVSLCQSLHHSLKEMRPYKPPYLPLHKPPHKPPHARSIG